MSKTYRYTEEVYSTDCTTILDYKTFSTFDEAVRYATNKRSTVNFSLKYNSGKKSWEYYTGGNSGALVSISELC